MSKIDTVCPECQVEITVDKYVKYTMRELEGAYVYYKITCPACGVRTQTRDEPVFGSTTLKPMPDKAVHRDTNSGSMMAGSARWADIPSDLKQKLEEEARLRKEREEELAKE